MTEHPIVTMSAVSRRFVLAGLSAAGGLAIGVAFQGLAAAAFLQQNPKPSDADIDAGLSNICRCGTYERIRKAIHRAAALAAR